MIRIFFTLAFLSIMLLLAALMMGLTMGDLYARPEPSQRNVAVGNAPSADRRGGGIGRRVRRERGGHVLHWHQPVVQGSRGNLPIRSRRRSWRVTGSSGRRFPGRSPGCWPSSALSPWAERPTQRRFGPTHRLGPIGTCSVRSWESFSSPGRILLSGTNIVANHAIIEQLVAEVGRVRREHGLEDCAGRSRRFPTTIEG